ncbi:hypothetical protein JB92DRAFT_2673655, partial [Gautieria morchelliformis]
CISEQVQTLQISLSQAESIISPCPACHNNIHSFFCSFTCSPNQANFLNVTATKSVDFDVTEQFSQGIYDSCKDTKFSASNEYAMDFIGGGAKNYSAL